MSSSTQNPAGAVANSSVNPREEESWVVIDPGSGLMDYFETERSNCDLGVQVPADAEPQDEPCSGPSRRFSMNTASGQRLKNIGASMFSRIGSACKSMKKTCSNILEASKKYNQPVLTQYSNRTTPGSQAQQSTSQAHYRRSLPPQPQTHHTSQTQTQNTFQRQSHYQQTSQQVHHRPQQQATTHSQVPSHHHKSSAQSTVHQPRQQSQPSAPNPTKSYQREHSQLQQNAHHQTQSHTPHNAVHNASQTQRQTQQVVHNQHPLQTQSSRNGGHAGTHAFQVTGGATQQTTNVAPSFPGQVELPHQLIGRLLCHHQQLNHRLRKFLEPQSISYRFNTSYTIMYLSTNSQGIIRKIDQLIESVVMRIRSEHIEKHCMHFPMLFNPQIALAVNDIEQKHHVAVAIECNSGNPISLGDLAQITLSSVTNNLIRVSDLHNYIQQTPQSVIWFIWNAPEDPILLPEDLSEYLSQCCDNNESESIQFQYNGKQYAVSFSASTFTDMESGIVYQLLCQLQSVSWSYLLGEDGYVDHESRDSEAIEQMYQYGGDYIELAGIKHTFDFDPNTMSQIDLTTGRRIGLQRNPSPESSILPQQNIVLVVTGLQENISQASCELEQLLNSAVEVVEDQTLLHKFHIQNQEYLLAQLLNIARQYCVLFSTPYQTLSGYICIKLQGDKDYMSNVHTHLKRKILDLQLPIVNEIKQSSPKGFPPPDWQQQTQTFGLADVPAQNNREWNMALGLVQQTMPTVQIVKLQRIQNLHQWEKYDLEKQHMIERNSSEVVNEMFLFHGSSETNPIQIAETGFDFRVSRRGLWGYGTYFAVNASYSDNYCSRDESNFKQLILARVLTGRSFSYGENHNNDTYGLTLPPRLSQDPSNTTRYDTVNGVTRGSQVFVVYDHVKSYPAYIITYV